MRHLLGVGLAFAALLGATALAVGRFQDRELFVSPPDAIAEDFVRAAVMGRYGPARTYLADVASMTEDELRALDAPMGEAWNVEAKVVSRDDARAIVNVRVSGPEGSEEVALALVFDREWKVVRVASARARVQDPPGHDPGPLPRAHPRALVDAGDAHARGAAGGVRGDRGSRRGRAVRVRSAGPGRSAFIVRVG